ncbi:protoporphyrinogen oxidase, partial [Acidihalobacter prosperus]
QGARVRLLEADEMAGGKIRSQREQGYLLDAGPNSLLDRKDGGLNRLLTDLSLDDRVIEANPAANRRYVSRDHQVIALPTSPGAFLRSSLFSWKAKFRLLSEPWRKRSETDESVASFVRRRLGPEFLDWAVDPFVSGVYAGDPEKLSVRAATGRIYALEAESGSLFLGAMQRARQGRTSGPTPKGRMISFKGGIGELPTALANQLGDSLQTRTPVQTLRRNEQHWVVDTPNGSEVGTTLILATPAYITATLLEPFNSGLASLLRAIEYPDVVSLGLGFSRRQIEHPLDGFGLLIPRLEGCETLGALFSTTLFPERAPDEHVLLTAFIGGARNPHVTGRTDSQLVSRTVEDLRPFLGLIGDPVFSKVNRWQKAIPQYTVGYLDKMAEIERGFSDLPNLHALANWRGGISVGDCINSALKLADQLSRIKA